MACWGPRSLIYRAVGLQNAYGYSPHPVYPIPVMWLAILHIEARMTFIVDARKIFTIMLRYALK